MKKLLPKEGYDKLAKTYKKYHNHLDKWHWLDFLDLIVSSEDNRDLKVLDLGSGDCRLYKFFVQAGLNIEYKACDISSLMLSRCPSGIKTYQCDLNKSLPFEYEEFDIVLAFFVFLHVENLNLLAREIYRILKSGGKLLIFHHIEKKPMQHKVGNEKFVIQNFGWTYQHIKSVLIWAGFEIQSKAIMEENIKVGEYILAIKFKY